MRITPAADVSVSLASILIGESGADFADVSLACCGDDPEERLEGGAFICAADEPEIAARAIATARANGA
ncbi:MAG: hypothetical protein HUK22_01940, partial [Thermoguttaceae bacterium]|nr:hypothetical protein [Thermoguttaceae bacterium]